MVDRGALAKMVPVREDSITSLSAMANDDDDDLPDIHDIIKQSHNAKAVAKQIVTASPSRSASRRIKIRMRQLQTHKEESDDDLEIIQPMPEHLKAFDRVKPVSKRGEVHSKAIHALKHLAHLTYDSTTARGKKALKPVVPPNAVNAQLIATAKAQARQAQQERLAELQAKGVVILNAEEREKEHDQFENLLERARQEAEDIRKQEKAARRKDNNEGNVVASDDEEEDADWAESGDDEDVEEDEEHNTLVDDVAQDEEHNTLIDDVAGESESEADAVSAGEAQSEADAVSDGEAQPTDDFMPTLPESMADTPAMSKPNRKPRVILDEDDEDDFESGGNEEQPAASDPYAAFGFDAGVSRLMSPTQAFAATMQTPTQLTQAGVDSSISKGRFSEQAPRPTFGDFDTYASQSQVVPGSQLHEETQEISLHWDKQMPETPIPELRAANDNVETPGWEPSQDAGLPSPWTVARRVEPPEIAGDEHETQSTVLVRISESPGAEVPRHRGRLTKGLKVVDSDDEEALVVPIKKSKNAFAEMQRRRMESLNATDRAAAEQEMKEMMDDQADESEDEYAGLGGDDSAMIAPETEEDRAMIDESHVEIDERQERDMQKFFAERQRAADEEATSKLFKDLTTGALRRRQGVGWELDEDEDEIEARRRQIKQREEARKRRLLLQDDNVKGLLEGKGDSRGREAFLRTLADDEDDREELDQLVEAEVAEPSQQESQIAADHGPLREISNNKRQLDTSQTELPQAKARRTRDDGSALSRPTSMLQVRESLSFLLDDPEHATFETLESQGDDDAASNDDYEEDDAAEAEASRDNNGGYAPDILPTQSQQMPPPPLPADRLPASQRRTAAKPAVIDRLSLRRGSSSSSSTGSMGWSAWSTGSGAASKVPSLLRRATSNVSANSNTNSRGVSYSNAGANDRGVSICGGARMGGNKKSSLAYQSRAQERKALGERAEKKKEESRRKIAEIRRQQGGALASGLGNGQFE